MTEIAKSPSNLVQKTDLKNWAGVYIWNPHHATPPPSSFSFAHACTPLGCKNRFGWSLA